MSFHAVPTPVRAERRAVFFAEILPELRALVDEALTAGDGWRMLRHSAEWWWHDGRLHRRLDW